MDENKHKVYVVNFSNWDYSSAESKGELIFMTRGFLDLSRHESYYNTIKAYLGEATVNDYLLFSSQHLICSLALKAWFSFSNLTKCNILIWDNRHSKYDTYTIER